jgi:hypothetical protein
MTVLMASGCVVRAGRPHRHWFWHRHAEITNPVNGGEVVSGGEALTLPPRTETAAQ